MPVITLIFVVSLANLAQSSTRADKYRHWRSLPPIPMKVLRTSEDGKTERLKVIGREIYYTNYIIE